MRPATAGKPHDQGRSAQQDAGKCRHHGQHPGKQHQEKTDAKLRRQADRTCQGIWNLETAGTGSGLGHEYLVCTSNMASAMPAVNAMQC
jgi:hypothetical protein